MKVAFEGNVALGPAFQEAEMVLQKFHRGQRHLRSSASKFVENPSRRRKLGRRERICRDLKTMQWRILPADGEILCTNVLSNAS